MPKAHILLMEDDAILRYALKEYLEMQGFTVTEAEDGEAGVACFQQALFDLCIIDVMMPRKDGFTAAKEIHRENPKVPFLFLTARSMKVDKLKGFQLGADDYVVKPVDEEELIARIEVILRRNQQNGKQSSAQYNLGAFTFEPVSRRLSREGHQETLTEKEAQLLTMLCESRGQLLDRKTALLHIWGQKDYFSRRSMDVHIARLRKALHPDPSLKITNVHGKGFILEG